jgi:hypothetical protein
MKKKLRTRFKCVAKRNPNPETIQFASQVKIILLAKYGLVYGLKVKAKWLCLLMNKAIAREQNNWSQSLSGKPILELKPQKFEPI